MTTPIRITTADEESSVGSSSVLTPVTHTTNFTHVERMDAGTDTDSFTDITATTMASDDWTAPFVHVVVHHHHQETADTPTTIALEEPHQQPTATPVTRNSLRQANTTHLRMTAGLPVGYQTRLRGSPLAGRYTNGGEAARVVKSTKQGPSHRKIRRWNNDKFVGVAAELTNPKAAEAFSRGEAEAHQYMHALPNAPRQYRSSFASLVEDDNGLEDVRSRFIRGEVGAAPRESERIRNSRSKEVQLQTTFSNGTLMLERLPERLRGIAVRAVSTSEWAAQVVTTLEDFLVGLSKEEEGSDDAIEKYNVLWNAILVQPPRVTRRHAESPGGNNDAIVQFLFDLNRNPKQAAFHRLLLHAVCHFHGLSATSDTVARLEARALTVTGQCRGSHIRLVNVAKSHLDGPPVAVLDKDASLDSRSTNRPVDQVVELLSSLKVS